MVVITLTDEKGKKCDFIIGDGAVYGDTFIQIGGCQMFSVKETREEIRELIKDAVRKGYID